jgi:hypothetical protein
MSVRTKALFAAAGLAALAGSMSCGQAGPGPRSGEDRPPIIVENDSIHFSYDGTNISSQWKKEEDDVYEQQHSKGKTVVSFSASVGGCTATGVDRLKLQYGSGMVVLERHRKSSKYHTDAIFPAGSGKAKKIKVDNGSASKKMTFDVADKLTRIDGDSSGCDVKPGDKITVTMVQSAA